MKKYTKLEYLVAILGIISYLNIFVAILWIIWTPSLVATKALLTGVSILMATAFLANFTD